MIDKDVKGTGTPNAGVKVDTPTDESKATTKPIPELQLKGVVGKLVAGGIKVEHAEILNKNLKGDAMTVVKSGNNRRAYQLVRDIVVSSGADFGMDAVDIVRLIRGESK